MLKSKLTLEEQCFAAEHHRLIPAYLIRRGLPVDEYYAVAALGYLDAVRRYYSQPALHKHAFSTVANRAMRQSVSHALRTRYGRRNQIETVSLETGGVEGAPLAGVLDKNGEQKIEELLLLHALSASITAQQLKLVRLRLAGYSVREIAAFQKTSEKKVRTQLKKVRRTLEVLQEAS